MSSLALRVRRPGLRRLPVRRPAAGLRGGRPRPRAAPTVLRRRRRLVSVSALCTKETRIELILCDIFVLFGAIHVWFGVTGTREREFRVKRKFWVRFVGRRIGV